MKLIAENLMIEPAISGGAIVRFETFDLRYSHDLMHKYDGKKMTVEIKEKRKGRSLDANAYCWVLCDKIAAVKGLRVKKVDVYREAIRDYGVSETLAIAKEGVAKFVQDWEGDVNRYGKFCDVMGESKTQKGYFWVRVYYGSRDYNTKEMSVLIDGLVADAQDLGIETMTPNEIAELKAKWGEE